MKVLNIKIQGQTAVWENPFEIVSGSQKYLYIKPIFDSSWDGLDVKFLFRDRNGNEIWNSETNTTESEGTKGLVRIPADIMTAPYFLVGVLGYGAEDKFIPTASLKIDVENDGYDAFSKVNGVSQEGKETLEELVLSDFKAVMDTYTSTMTGYDAKMLEYETAEEIRNDEERRRAESEEIRTNAETERVKQEQSRQENEEGRGAAEVLRDSEEILRKEAEELRDAAEKERSKSWEELNQSISKAIEETNQAKEEWLESLSARKPVLTFTDTTKSGWVKFAEIKYSANDVHTCATLNIKKCMETANIAFGGIVRLDCYMNNAVLYAATIYQLAGNDVTPMLKCIKDYDNNKVVFYIECSARYSIYATADVIHNEDDITFFSEDYTSLVDDLEDGTTGTYITVPYAKADERGNRILSTYATKEEMANAIKETASAIKEAVSGTELVLKNISPLADSIKIKTSDDASVYVVSETIDGTEWEFSTAAASVVSSYIPVQPNEEYFLHCSVGAFSFEEYGINLFNIITYYDSDMQAVSTESVARNGVATVPDGCYYMVIQLYDDYGTTYNNDIYINALSDILYEPVDGVVTVGDYNPEYVYIKSCTGDTLECEYSKDTKSAIEEAVTGDWELISSGTLTEEVATLVLDGFSCSKVKLCIRVAGSENNPSESAMMIRTNRNANIGGGSNSDLTRMFRGTGYLISAWISLEMYHKTIKGLLYNGNGIYNYVNCYLSNPSVTEYDSIEALYLKPYVTDCVFGVGTTYELWGVRK